MTHFDFWYIINILTHCMDLLFKNRIVKNSLWRYGTMTTRWIAVTGLDGSGKTTLVDNLVKFLESKGFKVYRDRFPHDKYLTKTLLNESKDAYTDRLLFALDNRIAGTHLRGIIETGEYDFIVTQRCFLDSFVHGAVQGYSYSWVSELNHVSDLPKCDIMVHMVAEARIAYARICNDPDADKFEYPEYIGKQEQETRRAYVEVEAHNNPALIHFNTCQNIYMDTTQMSTDEVFETVSSKLVKMLNL